MASTSNFESIQGWAPDVQPGAERGSHRSGLGPLGEFLVRAARDEGGTEAGTHTGRNQWRDETPVP